MKTLLANKQTEEQIKANENARYLFIMAMMNLDEKAIFCLLNKSSFFLGNKNNWQFIHWLKGQFKGLMDCGFHSKFSEGISLDYYPGSETLSFFYYPMQNNENFETDPFADFNDDQIRALRFVLSYNNGKIIDIKQSKRTIIHDLINKFKIEN
jgi:hypothetical protein